MSNQPTVTAPPIPPHDPIPEGKVITFHCTIPYCNFVTRLGKTLSFVGGEFHTKIADEAAELKYEISQGHQHIKSFIERVEKDIDPMTALKEHFYAQFQREQAEATMNPDKDMGNSVQAPLRVSNSKDIAPVAAGGSGEQLVSQVKTLKIGPTGTKA